MTLNTRALVHRYGNRLALNSLNLSLGPGVTGLLGENGAGKTTLLKACSGALAPTGGDIIANGYALYRRGTHAKALSSIALMPQLGGPPSRATPVEFITYVTWMRGHRWSQSAERAREALDLVDLDTVRDRRIKELSGGMHRRLWLAQALAAHPEVLLLDEPSTGLDPRQRATMVKVLSRIADLGTTILMSSHVVEDLNDLAQRLIVLTAGQVAFDGPTPPHLSNAWFLETVGGHA